MNDQAPPRIAAIIMKQVDIVVGIVDSYGSLFLAKPTPSYTPKGATPPKFGSGAKEALLTSQSQRPITQFLDFTSSHVSRIQQAGLGAPILEALNEAISALQDYAEVHESEVQPQATYFPEGLELALTVKRLKRELSFFKSADDWVEGDNQQPLPFSRTELKIIEHALETVEEAASLPKWSQATRKQILGVKSLLLELRPVLKPISKPLMDAWNAVIGGMVKALKALQTNSDKDGEEK